MNGTRRLNHERYTPFMYLQSTRARTLVAVAPDVTLEAAPAS
jgi:hypothetical protein